jgi:hypothetical protein
VAIHSDQLVKENDNSVLFRRLPLKRLLVVVLAFFTLLFVTSWLTTLVSIKGVEQRNVDAVRKALSSLNRFPLDQCEIEFEGRSGVIRGVVFDRALLDDVTRLTSNLGLEVKNDLIHREMENPHILVTIDLKKKSLAASGLLPKTEWKLELEKQLRGLGSEESEPTVDLSEWKVATTIEEKEDVFEPKWIAGIGALLPEMLGHKRSASIQIEKDTLTLTGEVFSDGEKNAISEAATAAVKGTGLILHNEFRVVEPPKPPFFSMSWGDHGRSRKIDAEVANKVEQLSLSEGLMANIPPAEHPLDSIRIGDNIDEITWGEQLLLALPGLVAEASVGSFWIGGKEVNASGEVTSHGMRESLLQLIEQTFPDDQFKRTVKITVVEPPSPSIISVINLMGESIRLKGTLPDEATKKQLFEEARKRLPKGMEIGDEIEIKSNATKPEWIPALLGILPGFVANSVNGGLTIYENSLAIEARVDADVKWDAMYALSDQFFPAPDYQQSLEITLIDPNNPEEDLGPLDPDFTDEEMAPEPEEPK